MNNPEVTLRARKTAELLLDTESVSTLDIRMASEDFAFYSQKIPACFFRLGTGNKAQNITANVHQSNFDIDENALAYGSALMASMVL